LNVGHVETKALIKDFKKTCANMLVYSTDRTSMSSDGVSSSFTIWGMVPILDVFARCCAVCGFGGQFLKCLARAWIVRFHQIGRAVSPAVDRRKLRTNIQQKQRVRAFLWCQPITL